MRRLAAGFGVEGVPPLTARVAKTIRRARSGGVTLGLPLLTFIIGTVAVVAYLLTLKHASFRADDFRWISAVATPESGVMWGQTFSYFYSIIPGDTTGFYRPLFTLAFAVEYAIWGTNPFGYALTAVLLHAVAAVFVGLIALELSAQRWAGIVAGLLFALYPTHPFSMNYVGDGSCSGLSTTLYLISLFSYVKFAHSGEGGERKRGYLLLSLGTFLLALLAKESALSLPVVALIYEIYRRTPWRTLLLPAASFMVAGIAYFAMRYVTLGQLVGGYTFMPNEPSHILPTFGRYMGLMLSPYNPNLLGRDYSPIYLVTLAATVLLIAFLAYRIKVRTLALFVGAFLVLFLPSLPAFMGLLDGHPGYGTKEWNQYIYLPSAFFCAGLALMVFNLDRRALAGGLAVALVAFYAVVQPINNYPWLVASDLVHASQNNPQRLPVSTYKGAIAFLYLPVAPGEFDYMGYEDAMSPWFRGSPAPPVPRDRWEEAEGSVVGVDKQGGSLEVATEDGVETFAFDRENLQLRFVGNPTTLRPIKVNRVVEVAYVEKGSEKVARSIEILPPPPGT